MTLPASQSNDVTGEPTQYLVTKWPNPRMVLTLGFIFGLYLLFSGSAVAETSIRLGCFTLTDSGLSDSRTQRLGKPPSLGITWCVEQCREDNYTFAGIVQRSQTCVCGNVLGGSRRAPLHECFRPCENELCGQENRTLVFIIADAEVEIAKGDTLSGIDVSSISLHQLTILGVVVPVVVVVMSLFIHCIRVSRRRGRLLKLYIGRLERGETGVMRPPNTWTISNTLCGDFFCCCCNRKDDDLDCEELLDQLDIDPTHRKAFTRKVKQYVRRCEAQKNITREEIIRILGNLAHTGSHTSSRNSLRKLAEQYGKSRRQKKSDVGGLFKHLPIPIRSTRSSPAKLCRRLKGSSMSSIENAFPDHNSNLSMHMNSSLYRMYTQGGMRKPFLNNAVSSGGTFEEDACASQCSVSQCSSTRLIPVSSGKSNSKDRSASRISRHKLSESQTRRKHSRESNSEVSDSVSDIDN